MPKGHRPMGRGSPSPTEPSLPDASAPSTELPQRSHESSGRAIPPRRSKRPRNQAPPSHAPNPLVEVYSIGEGFTPDEREELEKCVASLHASPHVAATLRSIRERAAHYLKLVRTPATGWGLEAACEIPPNVDICVYTGEIRKKNEAKGSNHRIDLGPWFSTNIEVDGSLADPALAPPGTMALVNHVCAARPGWTAQGWTGTGAAHHAGPNCVVRHEMTDDLLGFLVLTTSRTVPAGQQLSFDYDAKGGDFWSSGSHRASKAGHTLVPCRCAGSVCPLRRWR